MKLEIKKLTPNAFLPTRAHADDAGLDLYSLDTIHVEPGSGYKIRTGICANIPKGHYLQLCTRSSMAKKGWAVVGGVVDVSYKGELFVMLRNISNETLSINYGDRIAQMILYPIACPIVVEVQDIGDSDRGTSGWGDSGV